MEQRELIFGITKERKMLWKTLSPLKMPDTHICANVATLEGLLTDNIVKELNSKIDSKGAVSLKNGFFNIELDREFLKQLIAKNGCETCSRKEAVLNDKSFYVQYAVLRIISLLKVAEEKGICCCHDTFDELSETLVLIICEKDILEALKKDVNGEEPFISGINFKFSWTKNSKETAARLFYEIDRRQWHIKEKNLELYRAVLNYLTDRGRQ